MSVPKPQLSQVYVSLLESADSSSPQRHEVIELSSDKLTSVDGTTVEIAEPVIDADHSVELIPTSEDIVEESRKRWQLSSDGLTPPVAKRRLGATATPLPPSSPTGSMAPPKTLFTNPNRTLYSKDDSEHQGRIIVDTADTMEAQLPTHDTNTFNVDSDLDDQSLVSTDPFMSDGISIFTPKKEKKANQANQADAMDEDEEIPPTSRSLDSSPVRTSKDAEDDDILDFPSPIDDTEDSESAETVEAICLDSLPSQFKIEEFIASRELTKRGTVIKKTITRDETTPYMICELCTNDEQRWSALRSDLKTLGCCAELSSPVSFPGNETISLEVKLYRLVTDRYDKQQHTHVGIPAYVQKEKISLVLIDGTEFASVLTAPTDEQVTYISNLTRGDKRSTIFIVQDLEESVRAQLNQYNRKMHLRARAALQSNDDQFSPLRRPSDLRDLAASKASIQAHCGVDIIYTTSDENSTSWILSLIQEISMARYKSKKLGVVIPKSLKPKTDPAEATVSALTGVPVVPPAIAKRMQLAHKSLSHLMQSVQDDGEPALQQTQGIGNNVSSALLTLFTCENPNKII